MASPLCLVVKVLWLLLVCTYCVATWAPPGNKTSRTAFVLPSSTSDEPTTARKLLCRYTLPCPSVHTPHSPPLPLASLPDPSLCTHIIISSALLYNTTIVPCSPQDFKVYKKVVSIRKQNPSLKVMVSVEGNWMFLSHDPIAVAVFAYNAKQFLLKNGFGGLEVAWHPPSWPPLEGGSARHLSLLLLQLNNALKLASHPPFLLSLVVSSSQKIIDFAYDMRILNQTVDFVTVTTYDFHTFQPYLPFTGYGAPLQAQPTEQGYWATLNIKWAARYWLEKGLPPGKLTLTIPTYANTWKLLSSGWNKVGAPAVGLGMMEGHMAYPKVCVFLQGSGQTWDKASRVPYSWRSREWVSYENEASVKEKAELVVVEHLGGVALLDLNSDDWAAQCKENVTYPLLRAVKEVLSRPKV